MVKKLTDVIKEDFGSVASLGKAALKGGLHGLYSPFALTSGLRYYSKDFLLSVADKKSDVECFGNNISQITSAVFSQIYIVFKLGSSKDAELYIGTYLGILVLTNAIDYLHDAHKRAKNSLED